MTTETNKQFKHYLRCSKCLFQFQIDSDESNNTKIGLEKMKCPTCGESIMMDPQFLNVSGKSSKTKQHQNAMMSEFAMKQAMDQKRMDDTSGVNEEVLVRNTQKGKNFGKVEKISKKVIESIEEKVAPLLE